MKKVECNFFKNGEYLMFNMQRLMEFEAAVGQPIGEALTNEHMPINSIITGYAIGMKQHKRNAQQYYELFDELLSDETKRHELLSFKRHLCKRSLQVVLWVPKCTIKCTQTSSRQMIR